MTPRKLLSCFVVPAILLGSSPLMWAQSSLQLDHGRGAIQAPAGWFEVRYANVQEFWNATPQQLASMTPDQRDDVARIRSGITPCSNHAEALQRLREIEAEWGMAPTYTVIGGWPALQRRVLVPKPEEGDASGSGTEYLTMVTTAIATENAVIRFDGFAPENAPATLISQMQRIGGSFQPVTLGNPQQGSDDVQQLQKSPSLRMPAPLPAASALLTSGAQSETPAASPIKAGAATNVGTLDLQIGSESEIAVSANGTNIVAAQGCSFRSSNNGGNTFPNSGGSPGNCTGGDSSVAWGQSGNFYWSTIGSVASECPSATPRCNNTQEMARSTNNGQTFSFVTNVVDCLTTTSSCGFGNVPDQEHIAADRVNAASGGKDQVYLVFRQGFGYGISCSTDSGSTWTAVTFYNNGSTDFPRITVSQNGTVFVVTNNGNNIELDSFSSCQSGLTHNLNHVTIASGINQVPCPVSGLDRCNNGNILSSHTVAVDDTNANHLYAAYAVNTVAPASGQSFPGNENVLVRESTNGGSSWSSPVQVNQGTSGTGGRRFQPWICVTEGTAYVSWYDRRASTSSSNDLTDYYSSSAFDSGGTLTGGTDFQIDGAADPQCASGWPCQSRSTNDYTSCSTQPQLGGACRHTPNNNSDSNTPCNASTTCPSGETCQTGGGCPKYADYTGNACLLGRLYNVWPSATNQPGASPTNGNIVSFFAETVVGSTATTTTYLGPVQAPFGSIVTMLASLVLQGTSVPVTGQTITFTLGTQSCNGATNASGLATCNIPLSQPAGLYTVKANFAGSGNYQASFDSKTFTIVAPPAISKQFSPNKIVPGGSTTLTFSIQNPNTTVTLTGVGFSDSLPTGLTVASPSLLSSTCGGTTTAVVGSSTITLVGGSIAPSTTCSITVKIAASTQDAVDNNLTTAVTSLEGGIGNMGSATVIVAHPPSISKSFSAVAIPADGSAGLTFTIKNPNTVVAFTGVAFTDVLPTGLVVSTPNGFTGSCGGGTITAVAGSSTISLSGAALAAGASCTFTVDVTATQTGTLVNTTDAVTSDQTVPGNTATATIVVGSVFVVNYAANLNAGDAFINLTNAGENGAPFDGPGFGLPTGNLCVNVYALDPNEELISCCSCLVTPNGLQSLSIQEDVLLNTATGSRPNSVVLKLLSTLAGGSGSGTTCTNAAAVPGTLASGLAAWGTTLHATASGGYSVTENPYMPTVLSSQELDSLTNRCKQIIGNGTGAGICAACRVGGLGAERQIQ